MGDRAIQNPVTGERAVFVETSCESNGARTVGEVEVRPGGGVFAHRHAEHEERIEVLEGELEVTLGWVRCRLQAGEQVVVPRGTVHGWRNLSSERTARFRGTMTPGHPGFETALRVAFGLGRDGGLRRNGVPRRFTDLALIADWDPSLLDVGPRRLLAPLMRWTARRAAARARAADLLRRYGG
ncbi:MAG TPA: cupin domain-containing protein [Candidatus Binatia bacterium]|nr:cupin domain-containing protein [Candidatus Binatia bacterium]